MRVEGDRVETCRISGTIARGDDPLGDAEQIRGLLDSTKEESELTMCTDVNRNDKSRICVPGIVRVIGRRQSNFWSADPCRRPRGGPPPTRVRRARRVPHAHLGGHSDGRTESMGDAVHRRSREVATTLVRRGGRRDRIRRQPERRAHPPYGAGSGTASPRCAPARHSVRLGSRSRRTRDAHQSRAFIDAIFDQISGCRVCRPTGKRLPFLPRAPGGAPEKEKAHALRRT